MEIKFRKFKTSSGAQILLGKDMKQNEELVNQFKGEENIIIHTASPGSPFCVIDDLNPSRKDKKEAAVACAKYSQDWRDNKSDVKVHVFTGKQVYKRKGMKVGTFGVKKHKMKKVKKKDIQKFERK